jgi:mannose-6-phosphate isomerase-like protein (cupin superfamily)
MIHSLSGGVIENYEKLIYCFVETGEGKMWFISPYPKIKAGDDVLVPFGRGDKLISGKVERVEIVTKQTAPYPVNRTKEIDSIL